MDSITQIALGATVAELTVGKKAGNKAILWGSVFGTLPDLDVLLGLVFDEVAMLGIHRGLSHSIFFAVITAPLFGWALTKIHKNTEISAMKWAWMVFLVLITHIMLDAFTVYGTQLFAPFSNYPVGINSIFIIDPVYTLPMLAGVLITLFIKNRGTRFKINKITIIISTVYLALSLVFKIYTTDVIKSNLQEQNINYDKLITMPTPLNIFMYSAIALEGDRLYIGLYSIFDSNKEISFREVERRTHLIEKYSGSEVTDRLLWFSRGYYHIMEENGELYFADLRFGRSDLWMSDDGAFIFRFRLVKDAKGNLETFERGSPSMEMRKGMFDSFLKRVFGKTN